MIPKAWSSGSAAMRSESPTDLQVSKVHFDDMHIQSTMQTMCLRFYINKEWIVSTTARRVYLLSTILNIFLFILVYSIPAEMSETLSSVVGLVVFICALGAATTYVSMFFHFVLFKDSSMPKALLCALAIMFFPIGPPFYFFLVYWRSADARLPTDKQQLAQSGA